MKKIFWAFLFTAFVVCVVFPAQFVHAASAGDLVKCDAFDAVYYLAEDGERYVFPNERIYLSWYPDFHDVRTISCDDLASIPLGERVVYQAGTRLVKIPSDPSVYVVEHDGVLREIPDEDTAIALFGDDWNLRVDDVSEAFWPSFTVGAPLADDEVPEGTILQDDNGDLFRVDGEGVATEIDTVLTTDQEAVLETHALSVDDIEERLGIAIALTHVDSAAAVAVLEALIADLRTVDVDDDDAVEVEDFDEVESDDDDMDDVEDALSDAREEIAEAESDIAEDVADGKDATVSTALLVTAREHLVLAQAAYDAGDFAGAEEHADSARHDAMEARGKAVEHIDDVDDEEHDDENDDENSGDDDASDDSADDTETDGDEDDVDDESDSEEDGEDDPDVDSNESEDDDTL